MRESRRDRSTVFYLVAPPAAYSSPKAEPLLDPSAPLSKWDIGRAFATVEECEDFRVKQKKKARQLMQWREAHPGGKMDAREREDYMTFFDADGLVSDQPLFAVCVTTNDPRLKPSG
jgi:hypothetical protein